MRSAQAAAAAAAGAAAPTRWLSPPAHTPTEEFLERQRLACGPKPLEAAVMDCYAEVAEVWRQLAAATERKRALASLR